MKSTQTPQHYLKANLTILGLFAFLFIQAQDAILLGNWKGAIKIPGMELAITLDFQKEGDNWTGDMDIPMQNVVDMELVDLKVNGKNITFKLPEVPGNATFKGAIQADNLSILGDFLQAGQTMVLEVKRESANDKKNLLAKIEKIKALADSVLIKSKVPGLGFGIIKDGEIILAEGFGFKNIKDKTKVTANTQFAIGSSSKAFTTMGLSILEDEGSLDWEESVQTYIPEFEMYDDFASKEMTAVDLVCHRSGLPRHDLLWYGSDFTREELLSRIKYLEPNAAFRTKFQYQNLMFMTAGILTERLSKKSWESYIGNTIFRPLGMDNSNFSVDKMQLSADFAVPHQKKEDNIEQMDFRNIDAIGPAGSINSTVNDMLKWVQLHLNDGKYGDKRLVSSKNLKKMHRPHKVIEYMPKMNFPQFQNMSYGMGWFTYNYSSTQVVQHGGNIDGFSALVYLLPGENIGMVLLTNLNGNGLPTIMANYATDILLDKEEVDWFTLLFGKKTTAEDKDKEEPKDNRIEGTSPSHTLKDYVGNYENAGYGIVKVTLENNNLRSKYNAFDMELEHWHYDVFHGEVEAIGAELPFQFQMDLDGSIIGVEIPMETAIDAIVFKKQAPSQLKNPAFLEKLVGNYDADGLLIKVKLEGKKLIMFPTGQPSLTLLPYKGTSFKPKGLNGFVFEFVMKKGKATSIILNQPNGVFVAKRK